MNLNLDGSYHWHTFYGSAAADDYGQSIAIGSDGHAHVAGYSKATWGTPLHAYAGTDDIVALTLDW